MLIFIFGETEALMKSSNPINLVHIPRHTRRWLLIPVLLIFPFGLMSQELISTEFEKGVVKNGLKYSVWEYYDINRDLELKIDHNNGNVYFLKADTSQYVIEKDGEWIEEKLRIYPIPIDGHYNFRQRIRRNIRYPASARREGIFGMVMVMFEVDTTGVPGNYGVVKGIGGGCDEEVVRVLTETQTLWLPAQIDGLTYRSRFIVPIIFRLDNDPADDPAPILPLAKLLIQDLTVVRSVGRQ